MTIAAKKIAAKRSKTNQRKSTPRPVELDSEAWPKFEALVKSAAKMGHKPHASAKKRVGR